MEKTIQREALQFFFLARYYSHDRIKKNKMGGACDVCTGFC
jgi:hypothetical protein